MEEVKKDFEETKKGLKENLGGGKFFKFDKMITPVIIKIIFTIGIITMVLVGLAMIVKGLGAQFGGGLQVFIGLLILLLGPIIVRVNCELMIVVFKIHEALEDIRMK